MHIRTYMERFAHTMAFTLGESNPSKTLVIGHGVKKVKKSPLKATINKTHSL